MMFCSSINVIGYDLILTKIISEVKDATFHSVLADEVTSHNVEHLPICVRFVDRDFNIREELVALLKLARVRAVDIADAITETLTNLGLSLHGLRGLGYDGASTMSGAKFGVQVRILEKQPKAIYTHCAGHYFNLVVLSSCSIPSIRNCINQIKSLTISVKNLQRVERVFLKQLHCTSKNSMSSHGRAPLLNVCVTRWVENIDGWDRFSTAHPFCEGV